MPLLALDRAAGRVVRSFDRDGRLLARSVRISKATVSPYQGDEIPGWEALALDPRREYRLLRHPDEMRKAARTFDGLPVLSMHRPLQANDHARALTVGTIGDAHFDGEFLRAEICVWDASAIRGVEDGTKRELSCGYHYIPVMTPGVFAGKRFDGKMTEIKGNHVALVNVGRAGSDCAL
jgi:uncharacterized protein